VAVVLEQSNPAPVGQVFWGSLELNSTQDTGPPGAGLDTQCLRGTIYKIPNFSDATGKSPLLANNFFLPF